MHKIAMINANRNNRQAVSSKTLSPAMHPAAQNSAPKQKSCLPSFSMTANSAISN